MDTYIDKLKQKSKTYKIFGLAASIITPGKSLMLSLFIKEAQVLMYIWILLKAI